MRFTALLAALFLSGCALSSDSAEEELFCPEVGLIAYADVVSLSTASAVINGYRGECAFKAGNGMRIDLTLPFAARKNKDAAARELKLPYFVAVLSPDETVLQRKVFSATVPFGEKRTGESQEEQTVTIPVSSPVEAYKYKVVAGFVLTPEQLKQNKENK